MFSDVNTTNLTNLTYPYCRKLINKDNKFQTAAFMVSCDSSCSDIFYNESSWPAGCELRDWFSTTRKTSL